MNTLKVGSKGEDVKFLQIRLNEKGNYKLSTDGIFGAKTEEAVKDFQKKNKLVVDGIVGTKTWSLLGVQPSAVTRKINKIIIHCAATKEGKDYTTDDIKRWHLDRGFSDIGYHYVIYRDGSVNKGRDENKVGAHTTNQNAYSIGICYIGGLDKDGKPKDTRTDEQKEAMYKLVYDLLKKYNLKLDDVYGHYEFANKACPSFKMNDFKDEFKKWLKDNNLFV